MTVEYIKNSDISRIIVGIPKKHKHIRLLMALEDGRVFIFSEATIANIVRAYINVKTHPTIKAIKLEKKHLKGRKLKSGYAHIQLLEVENDENDIREELLHIIKESVYISSTKPS